MENKNLKLYNLLTLILPFVFLVFSVVSLALIPLSTFKFDFLCLKPEILGEVFKNASYYLTDTIIPIEKIILFFAFTVLEIVLTIIMLINVIILLCKVFGFLKQHKLYEDRRKAFNKYAKKSLAVMSLSAILFITAANFGCPSVIGKTLVILMLSLSFIAVTVMDVLFDRVFAFTKPNKVETILVIAKRVIAFATLLVMVLGINKMPHFISNFVKYTVNAKGSPETLVIIGNVFATAFYISITAIALKQFRKISTKAAFSQNKKSPFKHLMVRCILILAFSAAILVLNQFAVYGKFVSSSVLFEDLNALLLVPVLAAVSGIVLSANREKKAKVDKEVQAEATK